jgi:hypothetical protein
MLTIPLEKLAFIVEKAREFDGEIAPPNEDEASNLTDDDVGMTEVLNDTPDNPAEQELTGALASLNEDEKTELLALLWVGRGDFDVAEWQDALDEAASATDERQVRALKGVPLLADYLAEGVEKLGYSVEDIEPG